MPAFKNLYEVYAQRAEERGDKLAFDNTYSYQQAWNMAKNRARFFLAQGIGRGDVVGLLSVNGWEWCITYMAITSIGAVALQMDTNLNLETWQKMLNKTAAKFLIASQDFYGLSWKNVQLLNIHESWSDAEIELPDPPVDMQSPASLLFTSGTTSDPKIVALTHGNIYYTAQGLVDYFLGLKPGFVDGFEIFLCILPLYHVYGMQANFLAPFVLGGQMIFQNSLKGPDLIKSLAENPIHIFCGVPQVWELFFENIILKIKTQSKLKYLIFMAVLNSAAVWSRVPGLNKLLLKIFKPVHKVIGPQMKFFISGGASLKAKYFKYYVAMGFRILEGYGLTETTGPALVSNPLLPNPGSVGWPVYGNEVDIRNINADGIGEIWLRGASVMPSYYNNPEATKAAFEDGWFNTGDLGFKDKLNALHITGRLKNVIVLDSGKNVYPEELEEYYKNSALIEELAVFGYKLNAVETVYAVIVPREKTQDSYQKLKIEIERLNKGLPSYKIISAFAVSFEPLPRNSIKKLVVREIINELERGKYQKASGVQLAKREPYQPADSRQKAVLKILSERLDRQIFYADQTTLELEIDSLKLLDIAAHLEQVLSAAIDLDELVLKKDLQAIVEYVASCPLSENLAEDPLTGPLLYKVRPSGNPLLSFYTFLCGIISRRCWSLTIKNPELYLTENCIFAPNHQSYLDIVWIYVTMPEAVRRRTYMLAKKELSSLAWLLGGRLPLIYVDKNRSQALVSLKAGADVLRQNSSLVVFPEGMRSYDGRAGEFKIGAAMLAKKLGKKIVPVTIKGAYEIYPRQKRLPNLFSRQKGEVILSAPLNPADYATPEELNKKLKDVIEQA